jgi:hypothetical protein
MALLLRPIECGLGLSLWRVLGPDPLSSSTHRYVSKGQKMRAIFGLLSIANCFGLEVYSSH